MAYRLQFHEVVHDRVYMFCDRVNHVKGHIAVDISEDQTESSAVLPGFSYGDLDRTGNISQP